MTCDCLLWTSLTALRTEWLQVDCKLVIAVAKSCFINLQQVYKVGTGNKATSRAFFFPADGANALACVLLENIAKMVAKSSRYQTTAAYYKILPTLDYAQNICFR